MDSVSPKIMQIFPGQGSQYVGMGSDIHKEFAIAREIYQRASGVLGFDVAKLSFEGPKEQLDKTEYTQPALLTHSIACLEVFRELTGSQWPVDFVAGHSLGEYSALVAADALSLEDAVQLVRQRGRYMSDYGRGKMVAFRLDLESIRSMAEAHYCGIGGCNLPDQTVVCGFKDDLDELVEEVVEKFGKAKAGRFLNTEGAFHTYLMITAAERFRAELDTITLRQPEMTVLSNYTGRYHSTDPAEVKASLFFQIFHPVKWMWGLRRAIHDGVNTIIEFGGGIGRDRPGAFQDPATRKPNLEGITKKSQRATGREGLYLSAINVPTLRQAARVLDALQDTAATPYDDAWTGATLVNEKLFRLCVPVRDGIISHDALALSVQVREMGLNAVVPTVGECYDHNVQVLRSSYGAEVTAAEPYLEVKAGTADEPIRHLRGDAINQELSQLRDSLQQNDPLS